MTGSEKAAALLYRKVLVGYKAATCLLAQGQMLVSGLVGWTGRRWPYRLSRHLYYATGRLTIELSCRWAALQPVCMHACTRAWGVRAVHGP